MKLPNTLNYCVVKKDNFYIEKDEVNEIEVKFFATFLAGIPDGSRLDPADKNRRDPAELPERVPFCGPVGPTRVPYGLASWFTTWLNVSEINVIEPKVKALE